MRVEQTGHDNVGVDHPKASHTPVRFGADRVGPVHSNDNVVAPKTGRITVFNLKKAINLKSPRDIYSVVDTHPDTSIIGRFPFVNFNQPARYSPAQWFVLPSSLHGGSGTLAFLDGHSESKKWLDPGTRKLVTAEVVPMLYIVNEVRDYHWMLEHATEVYVPMHN